MVKETIPSAWETKRLTIKDLVEDEIQPVQQLYEQGSFIHKWDGRSLDKEFVHRCFTVGDLPPNGTKDRFKIQVIRLKSNEIMTGLLITYHGFPQPKIFYINYLYIDKEYQNEGLGHELVTELLRILQHAKYNEVRANVAMKNWPAVRFWTKLGLNTINGFFGDKEHGENQYADIELIKTF
ncbi:GNAT superfamily N-acetyltransferase [Metabacillus crassostreae]|uniref:GNAT family N-acetyltransferase n=1 Tax=Metabacillus crassostreae TaxID=929098 RepID=UPI001958BDF3|nr:GNAT superfamily N-acetyltransferase [Metabacillus crassostreae]